MRLGLIDVDGHNFPNLALMKISAWNKKQGNTVEWYDALCGGKYDIVFLSKVFSATLDYQYPIKANYIFRGGTGYKKTRYSKQVLSYGIENSYPDYSLYPNLTKNIAYGYLTRGCPRGCKFCIVGSKEGKKSVKVANLSEFWKGQKEIKLLDPNLFACKEHLSLLNQLVDSRAWIDFTQGLDIRLITDANIELIKRCRVKMLHFAWDNPTQDLTPYFKRFKEASNLDFRKLRVYVLTNFDSSIDEDLYRIYTLREIGYDPYVMIYGKETAPREIKRLQRWCNNKFIFRTTIKFEDYMKISEVGMGEDRLFLGEESEV